MSDVATTFPELSVVIPAKNEAENLRQLLPRLLESLPKAELIVVDDGSTDGTQAVLEKFHVKSVRHPISMGNGAAIKAGVRATSGRHILFMDGDGQHDPADAHRLLARLDEGYDMVVGARSRESQASLGRAIANKAYNWLATYMAGQQVKDLTSGFRLVNAKKFKQFLYMLPNGFSYPTTSTMAFFRAGYTIAYEPVAVLKRGGKSHIKPFQDGMKFLLIIFKIGTLYSPLKLFFPMSVSHILLALIYYSYTFSMDQRLSIVTIFLLISGILIFLIGLVSEQITSLMYKDD